MQYDADDSAAIGSKSSPPTRRPRWLRRLAISVVSLVAVCFAVALAMNWYVGSQRVDLLERFEALGIQKIDIDAFELIEATDADRALVESLSIVDASEAADSLALPMIGTKYALEPRQALPADMVYALRELKRDRDAFLKALQDAEDGVFTQPTSFVMSDFESMIDQLGSKRLAARVLGLSFELSVLDQDIASVEASLQAYDTLLRSLRDGLLIQSLVEMSVRLIPASSFEHALSRGPLPPATLLGAADRFEAWNTAATIEAVIGGEMRSLRWTSEQPDEVWAWMKRVTAEHAAETGEDVALSDNILSRGMRWLFPEVFHWGAVRTATHAVSDYEEIVKALAGDREEALTVLQDNGEADGNGQPIRQPVLNLVRVFDELQVAAAALRVEAHRMEHGNWPETLAAADGGVSPTDWTGRPLVYRIDDTGDPLVYGTGLNGIDDGGLDARVSGPDTPKTADDIATFRLYAPESRGALPEPSAFADSD